MRLHLPPATVFARALTPALCDPESDADAAARHVARLWRRHGGRWHDLALAQALVTGVAQLSWHCARRHGHLPAPPFAVMWSDWPRCVPILLPDDSRCFGVVIVWLRHFDALLPPGAPARQLVFAPRAHRVAEPRDDLWLWGCEAMRGGGLLPQGAA